MADFPLHNFWEVYRNGFAEPIARFSLEGHAQVFVRAVTETPTHVFGDTELVIWPTNRRFL